MSARRFRNEGGRVLAGLALLLCAAGCDDGSEARGPAPANQGEQAALEDAAAMLDAREPEDGSGSEGGSGTD